MLFYFKIYYSDKKLTDVLEILVSKCFVPLIRQFFLYFENDILAWTKTLYFHILYYPSEVNSLISETYNLKFLLNKFGDGIETACRMSNLLL